MLPLYWHPRSNVIVYKKYWPHWVSRPLLSKWINIASCQWKPDITRFIFKNWPFFLNFPKCITICRHLKNAISTFVPCMVILKLWYDFTPKQSLQAWNYGNMTKNLSSHLFFYLIGLISTGLRLWAFHFRLMCSKYIIL